MDGDIGPLAAVVALALVFAWRILSLLAGKQRRRPSVKPAGSRPPKARPPKARPSKARPPQPQPRPVIAAFSGRAWIVDGDTMDVDGVRIRMFGMDAPEMSQEGGSAAKRHLMRLVFRRVVHVTPLGTDIYGRTIARTACDGTDLSMAMVRDGYAVASKYERDFAALEWRARLDRKGLWEKDRATGMSDPASHRRAMRWHAARTGRRVR